MNPKASIITLTYNRKDLIEALDRSLKSCIDEKTSYEFIVVDNGNDGTFEALKDRATVIRHNNSGNFSTINNLAAKHALGDVLIFLNNDTVAQTDFVTDMVCSLTKYDQIGIVGACLYYPDKRLQHSGVFIQQNLFPANMGDKALKIFAFDLNKCHPRLWNGELRKFQAVTGACLAIRKKDFFDLGGFHEEFSWNFEDVDLCFRMQFHLKKLCVVSPHSILTHYESESGGDRNLELNLALLQGRWRGIVKADDYLFMQDKFSATSPSI